MDKVTYGIYNQFGKWLGIRKYAKSDAISTFETLFESKWATAQELGITCKKEVGMSDGN